MRTLSRARRRTVRGSLLRVSRARIFVYGTLMRGEVNHGWLGRARARFVGEAETAARYTLVDLGPYPALVEGGGTCVRGELHELDTAALPELDAFEGAEFARGRIVLAAPAPLALPEPHAWLGTERAVRGAAAIPCGDWRRR